MTIVLLSHENKTTQDKYYSKNQHYNTYTSKNYPHKKLVAII